MYNVNFAYPLERNTYFFWKYEQISSPLKNYLFMINKYNDSLLLFFSSIFYFILFTYTLAVILYIPLYFVEQSSNSTFLISYVVFLTLIFPLTSIIFKFMRSKKVKPLVICFTDKIIFNINGRYVVKGKFFDKLMNNKSLECVFNTNYDYPSLQYIRHKKPEPIRVDSVKTFYFDKANFDKPLPGIYNFINYDIKSKAGHKEIVDEIKDILKNVAKNNNIEFLHLNKIRSIIWP